MVIDKDKSVSFSGHRTEKLNCNLKLLERKLVLIIDELIKRGYTTFITGGCYGFDLMVFQIVLRAKKKYPFIKNIVAAPFKGQEKRWDNKNKELYTLVLKESDYIHYISDYYKKGVYHARNRFMVDNSTVLICYSNGTGGSEYTLQYALKSGLETYNIFDQI